MFRSLLWHFLALLIISYTFIPTEIFEGSIPRLSDDLKCSAEAIWMEARNQPLEGRRAVLDVIINRAKKNNQTICEVVLAHRQFSFITNKYKFNLTYEKLQMYNEVINMEPQLDSETLYYHTKAVHPVWDKAMEKVKVIGEHIFMKERK